MWWPAALAGHVTGPGAGIPFLPTSAPGPLWLSILWVVSDSLQPHGLQHPGSLSFTVSWNLLKFKSIELVILSSHLILCHLLLLLPSIFPRIRVFYNESALRIRWPRCWSFSFSISPSSEYSGLTHMILVWILMGWLKNHGIFPLFRWSMTHSL